MIYDLQASHLFNDPSVGDVIRLALVKVVILDSNPVSTQSYIHAMLQLGHIGQYIYIYNEDCNSQLAPE